MLTVREPFQGVEVPFIADSEVIRERYSSYLGDESKLCGVSVQGITFPSTADELSMVVARCAAENRHVRVSGARTGITGASVPEPDDTLVSLTQLAGVIEGSLTPLNDGTGRATLRVHAGTTLADLQSYLAEHVPSLFFPVDPTETWAALGGMAATNASGARTYAYGPMRSWVHGAVVVLPDGGVLDLQRGRDRFTDCTLELCGYGGPRKLRFEPLARPATKATLGYFLDSSGDVVDLFIGAEGTLGIFAELTLLLAPTPAGRLSYLQIFTEEDQALSFIEEIRRRKVMRVLAMEFIDGRGLSFVQGSAAGSQTAPAQLLGGDAAAALVLEIETPDDDALQVALEEIEGALSVSGGDSARSFAGTADRDLREVKAFRHAVPEGINSLIASRREHCPGLHKVATDMAVPDAALREVYRLYRDGLAQTGLDYAIFGHGGNNHFHVNILPRDLEELQRGKELYRRFAQRVVELGGAVAAEHGIGRMKRSLLELQYRPEQLENLRRVRRFFDPKELFNRGVLFDGPR